MKIFIATDITVTLFEGKILAGGKYSTILKRYYNAFGPIVLCARFSTGDADKLDDISDIVDSVVDVGSLSNVLLGKCSPKIREAMKDCSLVVGRCPSLSAYNAADMARKLKKPFFAESMGCAWDAYWNHGISGKILAPYMFFKMKSIVKNADYALYVTNEFLQKRYPAKCESIGASNVLIQNIDENVLHNRLGKICNMNPKEITLATTAAVNVKYKGQQYVMRAIPKLKKLGISVKYILIGEGDNSYLRGEAKRLGVSEQVEFKGRLPLDEVFELLDEADIYIQPSLQEGLPRSIIEAMSRACPVIGARTAGIPELIEDKFVVKRKSASDIANKIRYFVELGHDKQSETAKRNFEESKNYLDSVLSDRRTKFYEKVKKDLQK